jgi:hypothetical protein
MKMKKAILTALTFGMLSITPTLFAQAAPPDEQKPQADRPSEATVTGCLTEQQGAYTLATRAGEQITVSGSADLAKHKDHTVKLTGKKSDEGGKSTLNVSKIEMVSASCR